jgi:hypothetical protein
MGAPFSNKQKAELAQLARRAYGIACERDAVPDGMTMEDWRHREVASASGKLGLRCCGQEDYLPVRAHFLEMVGETGEAFATHVRAVTDARRTAEFKLVQACEEFGYRLSYADAICRRQNRGLGLDQVGEKTLWRLVFTIRNRGFSQRRKAAA